MKGDLELEPLLVEPGTEPRRPMERAELSEEQRVRLAELETSNEAILSKYPARQMATVIRRRTVRARRRRQALVAAPVLAVAAGIAMMVVPIQSEEPLGGIRVKGGEPYLLVYRSEKSGVVRMSPSAKARPGDRLQLEMAGVNPRRFGAVLSVDGRGQVTRHHPQRGDAVRLSSDGAEMLPSSFRLDDSPGFEAFFFVTALEPFDTQRIVDALEKLDGEVPSETLSLPDDNWTQHRVTLWKERP